ERVDILLLGEAGAADVVRNEIDDGVRAHDCPLCCCGRVLTEFEPSSAARPTSVPIQRALCGVAAPTTTAAGVLAGQPRAINRSAMRARCPRPIITTSVAVWGGSWSRIGA